MTKKELKEKFEKFIEEEGGIKEIRKKQKEGEKEIKKYRNYLEKNNWKSYEEKEKIEFFKDINEIYIPSSCIFFIGSKATNGEKSGHLFKSFNEEEVDELIKEGLVECKQVDKGYFERYEGLFIYSV